MMLMNIWIKNLLQKLGRGLVRPRLRKCVSAAQATRNRDDYYASVLLLAVISGCCGKELKRNIINASRAQGI